MADETIRVLFTKVDELTVQITELKTLLINSVIENQNRNMERLYRAKDKSQTIQFTLCSCLADVERLDRHRKAINKIERDIEDIQNTIKNTRGTVITVKNIVIGVIGLIATCTSIAIGVNQLMK